MKTGHEYDRAAKKYFGEFARLPARVGGGYVSAHEELETAQARCADLLLLAPLRPPVSVPASSFVSLAVKSRGRYSSL
jgi:hypothetical protein